MSETKIITIPHNGPITPRGGAMGPILTPHRVEINEIERLLTFGYPVVEHVNGKRVELKLSTLRADAVVEQSVIKPAKVEKPAEVKVVEVEEKTEEVKPEKSSFNKKNGGKNKGNKGNNDRVEDPTESK